MDAILKAAWFLVGFVSLTLWCATPVAAESEQVQFYNSPAAAAAKLPFSQAVRVGDVLYMSGAIGILPGKRELAPGGIEPETKQVMDNIGEVLKANGLTFDDVFKCKCLRTCSIGVHSTRFTRRISSRSVCRRDPRLVPADWPWMPKSSWNAGPWPANNRWIVHPPFN
jgi:enamine deaminase RidA (YjgF/YER057c/UK114 family)